MIRNYFLTGIVLLLITSCAPKEPGLSSLYPKKPADTTERKPGRAMYFYEQAEKDADINDSDIVVEPPKKKEAVSAVKKSQ